MDTLYLMVTITDRKLEKKFLNFYREQGLEVSLTTLGHGTASSEIRDFFGLGGRERSLLFHTVTGKNYERFLPALKRQFRIDLPGSGIVFLIPFSSVGGRKTLEFFTEGQEFVKGEESALKETKYELLVAITNQGYTELVMDAARKVHAAGGTIIHAKGTARTKRRNSWESAWWRKKRWFSSWPVRRKRMRLCALSWIMPAFRQRLGRWYFPCR